MKKGFRCLAIISDCLHVNLPEGNKGTANYSLMRQFQALAAYFNEVIICCPFEEPKSNIHYQPYTRNNIRFLPSKVVGGNTLKKKIEILQMLPSWLRLFKQANLASDIVYLRFPNNISVPALFYFKLKRKKMFATYTAPWDKDSYTSASYNFQRLLLKKIFNGPVWVYSNEETNSKRIKKSFSPTYSFNDWLQECEQVANRIKKIHEKGLQQLKLLSVGALDKRKNHDYLLKCCVQLRKMKIPFTLSIAGAGEMMEEYKRFIKENALGQHIFLKGYQSYDEIRQLFRENDFVIQPVLSEGYGKVPIEGFFHGAIPLLSSATLLAEEITLNGKRGFIFDIKKPEALTDILIDIYTKGSSAHIATLIENGREYVKNLTLEKWAEDYYRTLITYFDEE